MKNIRSSLAACVEGNKILSLEKVNVFWFSIDEHSYLYLVPHFIPSSQKFGFGWNPCAEPNYSQAE